MSSTAYKRLGSGRVCDDVLLVLVTVDDVLLVLVTVVSGVSCFTAELSQVYYDVLMDVPITECSWNDMTLKIINKIFIVSLQYLTNVTLFLLLLLTLPLSI
jgi:hypothetical protein